MLRIVEKLFHSDGLALLHAAWTRGTPWDAPLF
jgi:hypothetical protein